MILDAVERYWVLGLRGEFFGYHRKNSVEGPVKARFKQAVNLVGATSTSSGGEGQTISIKSIAKSRILKMEIT